MSWAGLVLLGMALAQPPGAVTAWTVSSLEKVFPDTTTRKRVLASIAFDPQFARRASFAQGEVGDIQIAVRSDRPIERLEVLPFDLQAEDGRTIPIADENVFREHYVYVATPSGNAVTEPGWWPDALIPQRHVKDPSLPANHTVAFWLDLPIPRDASPGYYQADVRLSADGEIVRLDAPLWFEVLDIEMPVERHVRANVAMFWDDILLGYANEHWAPEGETWTTGTPAYVAIKKQYYELLLQHRFTAYDLPVPMDSPEADAYYHDPRVHSIRLPWLDDEGSQRLLRGVARARAEGAGDKLYYYAADEPPPGAYADVIAAREQLRDLDEDLPFVVTVAPVEKLLGAVDIWAPNLADFIGLGYLDFDRLAERRRLGEETWWYTCCVPLHPYPTWLVDDDAVAPAASIWLMAHHGLTGFVYSMGHGWSPDPYTSVASFNDTNGDGLLTYPGQPFGTTEPFPSIRLKLLRDGLQDYEIMRLLAAEVDRIGAEYNLPGLDGWDRVRQTTGRIVQAPYEVRRDQHVLRRLRDELRRELLGAQQHDITVLTRGGGEQPWVLEGTAPLGQVVVGWNDYSADVAKHGEAKVGVGASRVWRVQVPPGHSLGFRISTRPAYWENSYGRDAEPREPARPAAQVARADLPLTADGQLNESAWSAAEPITLENGALVRFAYDGDALYMAAENAHGAIAVIDPYRRHEAVYTFTFGPEPVRALRRTEEGRDPGYAPEWQAAGEPGRLEARIPFAALGVEPPRPGDVWGATAIGYAGDGRAFWVDHHGDLRILPELRF